MAVVQMFRDSMVVWLVSGNHQMLPIVRHRDLSFATWLDLHTGQIRRNCAAVSIKLSAEATDRLFSKLTVRTVR